MKRLSIFIAVMAGLLATASMAKADQLRALLTGYEETPAAVSTTARGVFSAIISDDGQTIRYRETYNGLQGKVTQSHIHVGQLSITGSVVIFLCQTDSNKDPTGLAPQCPQEGTVEGTITSANVVGGNPPNTQQLAAGDLAAVVTAIRAGATYANVHTDLSPGGEIRGQ